MNRRGFLSAGFLTASGLCEWPRNGARRILVKDAIRLPDAVEVQLNLRVVDLAQRPGTPERYGAKADCVGNSTQQLAAATDSTVGIQSAIDYAMFGGGGRVVLQGGGYKVTDTVHLGYGAGRFGSVSLAGQGYRFRGEAAFAGTAVFSTRVDRPVINIQGARGTELAGVALIGLLARHISEKQLCESLRAALLDDTLPESWDDPRIGGAARDTRYAPYAGICIDAYAGPRRDASYPAVGYPWFLGNVGQYGKLTSSDVRLEDCYIGGFTVGVVCQPCDADANGEYTSLNRIYIERCKWGVSVGNSQSRNVSLRDVKMSQVYACLTNRRHGRQIGKFGGSISDLSVASAIRVVDFTGYYAEPIHFTNFYGESLWTIGEVYPTSSTEGSILFTAGEFHFDLQNDVRGRPAAVFRGGYAPIDLQLKGCYFLSYGSVLVFDASGLSFDGCYMRRDEDRTEMFEKLAHNVLAGGLVTRQLAAPPLSRLKHSFFNLDSGKRESVPGYTDVWTRGQREFCVPLYAGAVRLEGPENEMAIPPIVGGSLGKSEFRSLELRGRTLVATFRDLSDSVALRQGPSAGDVILDDQSGCVFFVFAREGPVVSATLQNNYRVDRDRIVLLNPFATTGTLYWRNARTYVTTKVPPRGDAILDAVRSRSGSVTWAVREAPPNRATSR